MKTIHRNATRIKDSKSQINTDLLSYLRDNHGPNGLGSYVGRATKAGRKLNLSDNEILEALTAYWNSADGKAEIQKLILGALRFESEVKETVHGNN